MNVFEALKVASISMTGETVTVLIRDRDSLSSQVKSALSRQAKRPVCFVFNSEFNGTEQQWWTNGKVYNPNGPSIIRLSDNEATEKWTYPDGTEGRETGPASIVHVFNARYEETWVHAHDNRTVRHREDGPAYILKQYNAGGYTTWAEFRASYPKMPGNYLPQEHVCRGIIDQTKTWYRRGVNYNPNGCGYQFDMSGVESTMFISPMSVMHIECFQSRELRWMDERGALHRTDGPARIVLDCVKQVEKDGVIAPLAFQGWKAEWYIHGTEIPKLEIFKWARKNGIIMWNDQPCHDCSAFASEDGEFCFMTDFHVGD